MHEPKPRSDSPSPAHRRSPLRAAISPPRILGLAQRPEPLLCPAPAQQHLCPNPPRSRVCQGLLSRLGRTGGGWGGSPEDWRATRNPSELVHTRLGTKVVPVCPRSWKPCEQEAAPCLWNCVVNGSDKCTRAVPQCPATASGPTRSRPSAPGARHLLTTWPPSSCRSSLLPPPSLHTPQTHTPGHSLRPLTGSPSPCGRARCSGTEGGSHRHGDQGGRKSNSHRSRPV